MLEKIKELLKDTSIYGVTSIASQLIGFFLLPLYTSYLSPKDYGILAMVSIISSLFTSIGNLGLKSATMRFISRAKTKSEEWSYYVTIYFTSLTFSCFLFALCAFFSSQLSLLFMDDTGLYSLVLVALTSAWVSTLSMIPSSFLRIKRKVVTASIGGILNLVVTIVSTILMVVACKMGVIGAVLGPLVGGIFQKLYFLYHVPLKNITLFDYSKLQESLKYSLPYVPHYLLGVGLAMFGQFIVKEILSIEQAGLYNIAWRFCLPLVFIVEAFNKSWGPYQFEIYENDPNAKQTYRTFFSLYVAGTCILFFGISFFGEYVLRFVVQENFHEAAAIIPYLALIPLAKGIYLMLSTATYYASSPKYLPLISFAGVVALVILAYWLTPILGANGAALATGIGWLAMALCAHIYAQRIYFIPYDWNIVSPIWIIIIVFILFNLQSNWLDSTSLIFRSFILLLILLVTVTLFFKSQTEKARVKKIFGPLKDKILTKKTTLQD